MLKIGSRHPSWMPAKWYTKTRLAAFLAVFGIAGAAFILSSSAATPLASFEAETVTLSGPATVGSDSTASGGQYLQFNNASSQSSLTLPARAAFYYPWFPETWSVNGAHVAYHPNPGYYDSGTQSVVDSHIQALQYANVNLAIASWWGPSTHNETTRIPQLLQRTQALNSPLKWAFYYEKEGFGNMTVSELQSDLNYIKTQYAGNPSYARVNGKPVLFVYNADDPDCSVADRWTQANAGIGFYVNLKVMNNYKACPNQPDSWHQYAPAAATDSQPGYSYAISPGFMRADETAARLARDPARFLQNVQAMKASNAPWQLVTTFNEWGEGTAVEGAQEWASPSGSGTYLDILHNN